ncbi:hypothetical protein QYE76_055553 [Lolium multiflorum]|uniref:Uncharacterized protein n=1 Tax=Lolium multiflorum TaxID=4521 RepID=A0AAD8T0Z4_LOLMU|nr:hypothetical protein QYE76_055553 [Lolium multiflorum]
MAVPHYAYLKLKMPGNNGTTITIHGSFSRSDSCDRDFQKIASKFGAKEELNAVDAITDHTKPPADNRNESALIEFLRERWEIFAWEPSDMPGIPRELAEHALNVDPKAKPVQQSMRRFSEPKRKAIGEEVSRLRKAGFIRELKEAEWVANPFMVPKKDTTALRMCIDYTSLNKHCPKDHFPLPRIDQIVDSTAGCDRLSFLDAYSGYNQIKLKKEDQELTAFITPHGVFCYNVMTFGLKNAGATYQRCMQACLGEQIGRNIEVYIDDIVVKTKHAATLIDDLRETFDNLDRYKIKLNPKKCFFGVPGGQVLGYFISARGIEANPLKIKAILDMEPPKNLHQVQQLAGRLAALSRFIAKLGEKALPFYSLMKKSEKFEWTNEARESFDNLKKILSTSPVLVTPHEKETLLMYIAATVQVFSSVLVVEREEAGRVHGMQRPVYYLSEVLTPAKQRYPHHQKLAYAVIGRSNHGTGDFTGNFISNFIDTVIAKPGKPDSVRLLRVHPAQRFLPLKLLRSTRKHGDDLRQRPLQRQRRRNPSTAGIAHFQIDKSKRVVITRPFGWTDRLDEFARAFESPFRVIHVGMPRPKTVAGATANLAAYLINQRPEGSMAQAHRGALESLAILGNNLVPQKEKTTVQASGSKHHARDARDEITQSRIDKARRRRAARKDNDSDSSDEDQEYDGELRGADCLSYKIRETMPPKKFKPTPTDAAKYDGQQEPRSWIDDYLQTVILHKGNQIAAMQCLQLYLKDSARAWLRGLPKVPLNHGTT